MEYDLGTLRIERVILHDIPRHKVGEEGVNPGLSEIESPLAQDLKNYFKEKINASAASSSAFDVVFDPSTTSPVPAYMFTYLTDRAGQDFVGISQQIARHLFNSQSGVNSRGLLAFVGCSVEGHQSLAILKLEREEGVRVLTKSVGGKQKFNLDLIRELMLTGKTRLFKIGLFVQPGATADAIEGVVCDYQRLTERTEIADFFLSKFLGCQLAVKPEVSTKRFFRVSEDFCNDEVPDPAVRGEYLTHLFSEMTSQRVSVNPRAFAEENLRDTYRLHYMAYLEEHGVPAVAFPKDTKLIDRRIKLMSVQFQCGAAIIAPNDVFAERIRLTELKNGDTRAEIIDRVKGRFTMNRGSM